MFHFVSAAAAAMTTYASPRLTRLTLQMLVTLFFIAGSYMLFVTTLHIINDFSDSTINRTIVDQNSKSVNSIEISPPPSQQPQTPEKARFPSTSSPSVELLFSAITLGHSMFGIVAITNERSNILVTYSHILLISCFIKLLFLVASASMHSVMPNSNFMSSVATLGVITATVELILVMCVCQFAKLVKRGDAARQEIQSIHSFHLERRSRSRSQSQSRMRSFYSQSSFIINASPTPLQGVSRCGSMQDLSSMTGGESISYYVPPPPIFLKLDR